ncbi:MAG: hypothetical protein II073_05700 [Lachnospiraceae bacterium]|nr:hypothetical protein [Lachnospiraceae bacterium]
MSMLQQIPKTFYHVFRAKNREHYFSILIALYQEHTSRSYAFGLEKSVCKDIIGETMASRHIVWQEEEEDAYPIKDFYDRQLEIRTPVARSLSNLIQWGWLREEYDERSNSEFITFPEYSQLVVELMCKMSAEDEEQERESILSIYSLLYTFYKDKDSGNVILKNAWKLSQRLTQLMRNLQDGMRTYFDQLSLQQDFLGIQEVLINELNNQDSKKYTMLTTTDSFYRYKEQVKELISDIIGENEECNMQLRQQFMQVVPGSVEEKKLQRKVAGLDEVAEYMLRIAREFDKIEERYNQLIEQKSIFAKRALARVHFILQEGSQEQDNTASLIRLIGERMDGNRLLEEFAERLQFSQSFQQVTDKSMYQKRKTVERQFTPVAVDVAAPEEEIEEFIPQPLYAGSELQNFKEKNMVGNRFVVDYDSVESVEDLEQIMLLWQQLTGEHAEQGEDRVTIGKTITKVLANQQEVAFSQLEIEEESHA